VPVIGVSGHREFRDEELVSRGVDSALDRIAPDRAGDLTIVSPLAEGADRLVVKRAWARGPAGLIAPLPLERNDYLEDFPSPESKAEFLAMLARADRVVTLPAAESRYTAVGHWVLDHSEVLLALWDGKPAESDAGTGAVVSLARARRMPIAWVLAPREDSEPGSPPAGSVAYENWTA
jgi:hypothetical protein